MLVEHRQKWRNGPRMIDERESAIFLARRLRIYRLGLVGGRRRTSMDADGVMWALAYEQRIGRPAHDSGFLQLYAAFALRW